ncbi:hypothetical protein DID96_35445 [Burkholderia sp. Bp8963]|uniref:hypothetical protein n=1 Tax=Burkholderia sp. Bp8963 TaxID=2184547 RepID=UPI000F59D582|nr:hypothetical protein [Burkholderia sp. Bp8963]RQS59104.1 hypothetical protein DID96_35445 [Burkholderia sp. Bp8963]
MSALMINDLSRAQELSRKEMASVSGGSVFGNFGVNNISTGSGFSFASPNTITAPVTQVDASTHLDLTNVTNSINNLGGQVIAKLGL